MKRNILYIVLVLLVGAGGVNVRCSSRNSDKVHVVSDKKDSLYLTPKLVHNKCTGFYALETGVDSYGEKMYFGTSTDSILYYGGEGQAVFDSVYFEGCSKWVRPPYETSANPSLVLMHAFDEWERRRLLKLERISFVKDSTILDMHARDSVFKCKHTYD